MAEFAGGIAGVLAIDGKTARHGFDTSRGRKPMHRISAWASGAKLCLAQLATEEKSNEITAIPVLVDLLTLKGWTVPFDAMGTQRDIAEKIVKKDGDDVMALKGNQGTLHSDVSLFPSDPLRDPDGRTHPTVDADHGRNETRVATVSDDVDGQNEAHRWPGLKAVGKIERTVAERGETTTETACHLISTTMTAERYADGVRQHWGVENALHRVLDVNMDEDMARSRKDHAPENMSTLRRMAVNLLSRMKDRKPISGRMRKCVLSEKYRASVLVAI